MEPLKTVQLNINPDKVDMAVGERKQHYGKRIHQLYKIDKPVRILGEMRFDGPAGNVEGYPSYYLAVIHNGDESPANMSFLRNKTGAREANWYPIDPTLTISKCQSLSRVHWLPVDYLYPRENKHNKNLLEKLD